MENVLGIDLGGKSDGLAVVQQPDNRVLWCGTIHLSDRIKDLYDLRRVLRRARRSRVRYRKPKVHERGGGASGSGEQGATLFYRRAKGLNQSLRLKCKFVDPATGQVCEKNTPKLGNIRQLRVEDILGFAPFAGVPPEFKQGIRDLVGSRESLARTTQRLDDILSQLNVAEYLKKQLRDIFFGPGEGRAQFCREHVLSHHTQTRVPTQAVWLPPSIRIKQEFLIKQVRRLGKKFQIDRVVIERARFDLQKIAKGIIEDPTEYQQGHRYGFRNTRAALYQEYEGRCCYCGQEVAGKKWHVDHVNPQRSGQIDRWDNLAIACEKCNHDKGGRTPEDAGMRFAVISARAAGRMIRRSLAPKPLEESRISKYMTQTDQGIRVLNAALHGLFPSAEFQETFGYETSAWRQLWGLEKGKEKDEHHNDAIVIASRHEFPAAPVIDVTPQSIRQNVGGRRLFDLNPVARADNGRYFQQSAVYTEMGGLTRNDLDKIVDPKKRKLVAREFDRYDVKGAKGLPESARQRLGFKGVRLAKGDCADSNVRLMPTGHRFRICGKGGTRVNTAIVVYRTAGGGTASYAIKNRRAFGETARPADFAAVLWRFKPGDAVLDGDGKALGRVVKLGSGGNLTLDTGKARMAHRCRKGCA